MPIVLVIIGIFFLVSAIRGTTDKLVKLLVNDFTQQGGYLYWALVIFVIGAIGYIDPLKKLSWSFLTLVVLVLFISNRGFFAKFNEAIGSIGTTVNPTGFNPAGFTPLTFNIQPIKAT